MLSVFDSSCPGIGDSHELTEMFCWFVPGCCWLGTLRHRQADHQQAATVHRRTTPTYVRPSHAYTLLMRTPIVLSTSLPCDLTARSCGDAVLLFHGCGVCVASTAMLQCCYFPTIVTALLLYITGVTCYSNVIMLQS